MRVVIVASGQSAKGFIPPDDVTVIAVNGAIEWLSRADYWFSLDPSKVNLERVCNPRQGVDYHMAVGAETGLPSHCTRWIRYSERGDEPEKNTIDWWLWRWSAVKTLCENKPFIHTGNSAWGALGLAYHLGAEKVMLVGVDADSNPRVEGGIPNNLCHLPELFNSAIGQIDFINCGNMESDVPKMTIDEGLKWLLK